MENTDPPQKPTAADLQENAEGIAEAARNRIEDIDRDFNQKIDDLGNRVQTARGRAKKFEPESNNMSGMTPSDAKSLGSGLAAAYCLIGTPIVLYLIGLGIDRARNAGPNTVQYAPILGFVGFVLGLIFTVIVSNRHSR